MDVVNDAGIAFGAGVVWMNQEDGSREHVYILYETRADLAFGTPVNAMTFAKANGLGDLELLLPPEPIELGNRVWFDANGPA